MQEEINTARLGAEKTVGAGAAAVLLAAAVMLCGCGSKSTFPPGQSAIYISGNGELYTVLYGSYDDSKGYYSREELRKRAEQEAADYNASRPFVDDGAPDPVTITDVSMEGGTAKVVCRYADIEELLLFTEASGDQANHPESLSVAAVGEGITEQDAAAMIWYDAEKCLKEMAASGPAAGGIAASEMTEPPEMAAGGVVASEMAESPEMAAGGAAASETAETPETASDREFETPGTVKSGQLSQAAQVPASKVLKRKNGRLVSASGTVTIQTEERILYFSGAVRLLDGYTAQVTGGTAYLICK